jgi:peptidoglycan hydrolase-like protein with peptidoglycan-binding domain
VALVIAVALPAVDAAAPRTAPTPQPPQPPAVSVLTPRMPSGLPRGIEALSPYVKQVSCDPAIKPGALALGDLLRATYPGTSYSVRRDCGSDGMASEHYEGRAVDWFVSVRDPSQAARATALLNWLFAPDAAGNPYANARRLGVMYVIWDNRIWGSYSAGLGWRAYSTCSSRTERTYDTSCHRDHIHLSLSWAGAMRRTSFWTRKVAATDYGPCRPADLNWSPPYSGPRGTECPRYPAVSAPSGASSILSGLVRHGGATVSSGSSGPVVRTVQQALGLSTDGGFGPLTAATVTTFQRARGLPPTARMDAATWRALIAARAAADGTPPSTPPTPGRTTSTTPTTSTSSSSSSPLRTYARTTLHYGDRGAAVTALQKVLRISPVSGWFGPATRSAVIAFQRAHHLEPDAVVGPATWRALGA